MWPWQRGLERLGKQQGVEPEAQSVKCCDEKEGDAACKVGKGERKENKRAEELAGKMDLREELRSITLGTPVTPPSPKSLLLTLPVVKGDPTSLTLTKSSCCPGAYGHREKKRKIKVQSGSYLTSFLIAQRKKCTDVPPHTAHPLALEVFLLAWRWLVPGAGSRSSVRCCSGSWDVAAAAAAVVTLMVFFRFATCNSSKARANGFPKAGDFLAMNFFSFPLNFLKISF